MCMYIHVHIYVDMYMYVYMYTCIPLTGNEAATVLEGSVFPSLRWRRWNCSSNLPRAQENMAEVHVHLQISVYMCMSFLSVLSSCAHVHCMY